MKNNSLKRHGGAAAVMMLGVTTVFGAVVTLNQFAEAPERRDVEQGTAIEVHKAPKPKPKQRIQKPKPKPRQVNKAPPPPSLAAISGGLSGIAVDLPDFDMGDAIGSAGDLLGGDSEVTHTSATVDKPPNPARQVSPRYPAKQRDRGIEGYVLLGMLVNSQGDVEQVNVLESKPAGVFDEAAVESVRQWQFRPGLYKGKPVKTWVEQRVAFQLRS